MVEISVIMPAYNVEDYIEEAINSIENNGFERYELIIIDDASTDKTLHIARRKMELNSKIRVISTNGGCGCSYGRKLGLNVAKGKYIYFCDADDFIDKGTLEYFYQKAEKHKLDVVMINGVFKNELENTWGIEHDNMQIVTQNIPTQVMTGEELLKVMKLNKEWRYAVWLYFVKKELLINNVQFFKGIVHEDPPYNYQLLNSSNRVKFYNVCLYHYRLRKNSLMSGKTSIKDIEGYINAYNVIYNYNNSNYPNDNEKLFFEIRMLEQLEESFSKLSSSDEIYIAAKMIEQLFEKINSRNYNDLVARRIKVKVEEYYERL